MDFGSLFTSIEGRISRKPYWIGSLLLLLGALVLSVILISALGVYAVAGSQGSGISPLISLIILGVSVPIVVKRLHDRNKSTHYAWLLYGPAILSLLGDFAGVTGTAGQLNALGYALAAIYLIVALWFFIELGFLRGTEGANQYGPDPLAAG